jgi:hypothetical protein
MRRLVAPGVLLALTLTAIATLVEWPLFQSLGGSGPSREHFVAINFASAFLTLVVAVLLRWNGYFLGARPVAD